MKNKEFACELFREARLRSNNFFIRASAILTECFYFIRNVISYKTKKYLLPQAGTNQQSQNNKIDQHYTYAGMIIIYNNIIDI